MYTRWATWPVAAAGDGRQRRGRRAMCNSLCLISWSLSTHRRDVSCMGRSRARQCAVHGVRDARCEMKSKSNGNEGTSKAGTALQLKELINDIVEYVVASGSPCRTLAAVISAITCGVM